MSSIATLRNEFASWFDVADRFNNLGLLILPQVKPLQSSNQQVVAAALFGRALSSFQAAYILVERGMIADARTIVRSSAESAIVLSALVKDATVCERLLDSHHWHHYKIRNEYLKDSQALAEMTSQEIASTHAAIAEIEKNCPKIKDIKGNPVKIAELARQAGVMALYNTVFRFTSGDAAHTSLDSLNRHIRTDANNDIVGLIFEPDIADLPDTLHSAMSALGFTMSAVCLLFELKQFDNSLEQIVSDWKALDCKSALK